LTGVDGEMKIAVPVSPNATHDERIGRAMIALDGLSVGDAFGENFFAISLSQDVWNRYHSTREVPPGRWRYTDDTEMALAILEILKEHKSIDQDELAATFARRYVRDDRRGYGGTAHGILMKIAGGAPWHEAAADVFDGQGSMGNGGAMRVAPLGAYFVDDLPTLVEQARLSAEVTHFNPEGQAGAVAIAAAAAYAWNRRGKFDDETRVGLLRFAMEQTPDSHTRAGIARALDIPFSYAVETAASFLGNGIRLTAPDTVPFTLWCAARHLDDFVEAMWTTVSGGGDMDTNCAIVGGIVCLALGCEGIPDEWLRRREPLQFDSRSSLPDVG
jgi:ADP-ribosylglycohydrolase